MTVQSFFKKYVSNVLCILIIVSSIAFAGRIRGNQPALKTVVPAEWQSEPVVILSDTLLLDLKKSGSDNVLLMEEITWYKINKPSSGDFRKYTIWYCSYSERKPSVKVQAIYRGGKSKSIYNFIHHDSLIYSMEYKRSQK